MKKKSVWDFFNFLFFPDFLIDFLDFLDFFLAFFNKVYVIFLVLYPSGKKCFITYLVFECSVPELIFKFPKASSDMYSYLLSSYTIIGYWSVSGRCYCPAAYTFCGNPSEYYNKKKRFCERFVTPKKKATNRSHCSTLLI